MGDPDVGDGSGILVQIPDTFFRSVVDFDLPPEGAYATGIAFLPQEASIAAAAKAEIQRIAVEQGLVVLGWRDVPVRPQEIGAGARITMPSFSQPFFADTAGSTGIDLDLARIGAIRSHLGVSTVDVLTTICGGALRRYLLDQGALSAGASGAVFGLLAAATVGLWRRGINPFSTGIGAALVLNLFQQPKKGLVVRRVLIHFLHSVIGSKTPRANSRSTLQGIHTQPRVIRHHVQTRMQAVEPGLGQRILLEGGKHFNIVFAGKVGDSKIQQG